MIESFDIQMHYGMQVAVFPCGCCLVVAAQPDHTYEIAITNKDRSFPIRTLLAPKAETDTDYWKFYMKGEAENTANEVYAKLMEKYGDLPEHLRPSDN